MKNDKPNYEEVQDRHLDEMIRLVFLQEDALEAQEILNKVEHDEIFVDSKEVDLVYAKFLKKFNAAEKNRSRDARVPQPKRILPRLVQVAACLVLVVGIAMPFAIANVKSLRAKVLEMLINTQNDHTEVGMVANEAASFEVPSGWRGLFYPSYIPSGFRIAEQSDRFCYVRYMDEIGRSIYFNEYSMNEVVSIDSEDAVLSYTKINGADVFTIEKNGQYTMTWGQEDRFFVIHSDLSEEETAKFAENVKRIIK